MSVFAILLAVATPSSLPLAAPQAQDGVTDDPCATVPAMPIEVVDYYAEVALARRNDRPLPMPTAEGLAVYRNWNEALHEADYAYLCRYEEANQSLPAATPHRIVFMGDSITEAWIDYRPDFFTGDRIDRGIGGQTTQQMLARFYADVIALRPAQVHILAGTNDIAENAGPANVERIQNNLRAMVELANANRIRVILGTVTPAGRFSWKPDIDPVPAIGALNSWIRSYAREQNLTLVDYYAALDDAHAGLSPADSVDGVHPTASGYAKMEAVLNAALENRQR